MFLGRRRAVGRLDPDNKYVPGAWSATFAESDFRINNRFEIKHMSIQGPAGSSLLLYVDTTFIDTTPRGDLNSWDPAQPLPMMPGQSLIFYWNVATGAAPVVNVDCYTLESLF